MKTSLRFTQAFFLLAYNLLSTTANATFSIVAVDPVTREVGSAGATCKDNFNLSPVISYLVPGKGAANYQAYSDASYFQLTGSRMLAGDTAPTIMTAVNNSDSRFEIRQRIIITMNGSDITTAGFQGLIPESYAHSIAGKNYVIAGNILQGQHVLNAIENGFNNAKGDLTNKLMKAIKAATAIIGADTRCATRGTSSASAYLRVAKPTDAMNQASFFLRADRIINGLDPINNLYNQYLARRPDSDRDGTIDLFDQLPNNPSEVIDTDQDEVGNNTDADDDGDGISDLDDAFPLDPTETLDTDNDGTGDNTDAFPNDPDESKDTDSDGEGDNSDLDDDNDGIQDLAEQTETSKLSVKAIATQSSNYSIKHLASTAIDGNTNGFWNYNSVASTKNRSQPWWQLDLGKKDEITKVRLWNRTDCCANRLSNFYVLVSDTPFTSTNLNTVLNQPRVKAIHNTGSIGTNSTFFVNRSGRYIRVQLMGSNFLSLAEVEVFTKIDIDTDGDGVVDRQDNDEVQDPPLVSAAVCEAGVDPQVIRRGEGTALWWWSDGVTTASIDQGIGSANIPSDYKWLFPTETTTYTMTAQDSNGTATTCKATVVVEGQIEQNPPVCQLGADPQSIRLGEGSALWWWSDNLSSAMIDNGIGSVTTPSDYTWFYPTQTTTYIMTGSSATGVETSCQTTIVVN